MIDPLILPMILTISISGIVSIISTIQHSRCTEIRTPCCSCIRNIPKEQEEIIPFNREESNATPVEARVAEPRQILN